MTLEEAIKHAREVAESRTDLCDACRAEHRQLAEWLEELVRLREENERLKSVEFTCGFIKPHKVLECPIFDEIVRTKADTVREMQNRLAQYIGTYTDKSYVYVAAMFKLIDRIAKEMTDGYDT